MAQLHDDLAKAEEQSEASRLGTEDGPDMICRGGICHADKLGTEDGPDMNGAKEGDDAENGADSGAMPLKYWDEGA